LFCILGLGGAGGYLLQKANWLTSSIAGREACPLSAWSFAFDTVRPFLGFFIPLFRSRESDALCILKIPLDMGMVALPGAGNIIPLELLLGFGAVFYMLVLLLVGYMAYRTVWIGYNPNQG
jgi:hypothetical protein